MRKLISIFILSLLPLPLFAAQTGVYSWENILMQITNSLTGPVAYAISIMAVFSSGLAIAFTDLQGGTKRFVQVAFGISIAIFAGQIVTSFLGFNGALV